MLHATFKNALKVFVTRSNILNGINYIQGSSVVVLRYHSIIDKDNLPSYSYLSGIIHTVDEFESHISLLSSKYNIVTLNDIVRYISNGASISRCSIAVTFDDGFSDNFYLAAPILDRYGVKATFYVTTNSIGNTTPPWFVRVRKAFGMTSVPWWESPEDGKKYGSSG